MQTRSIAFPGLALVVAAALAGGCARREDGRPASGIRRALEGSQELTATGEIIANVTMPAGEGSRDLEVIRDGDRPPEGTHDPSRQYDSFTGASTRTEDWFGYQYVSPVLFERVIFQEGDHFPNGGWFQDLVVQIRLGSTWVDAPDLIVSPAYPGNGHGPSYQTFQLDFTPIAGDAIRVFGAPGGSANFASVAELQVFGVPFPVTTPDGGGEVCDDGDPCNGVETCDDAGRHPGTPPDLDDGNPCTVDSCDPAAGVQHVAAEDGTACSDGNACTTGDSCQAGACAGAPVECLAQDQCHGAGICDPGTGECSNPAQPDGTSCGDGDICNGAEICADGQCLAGSPPSLDDGNPCTVDSCDPQGGVSHVPTLAGTSCADGNECNGGETCDGAGACLPGTPPGPPPTLIVDACHEASCDPTAGWFLVQRAAGSSCADGTVCNGAETCDVMGFCRDGTAPAVDDGNACTADLCEPITGVSHTNVSDGTACGNGDLCLGAQTCQAGACLVTGSPPTVDDGNPCTADQCDPGAGVIHTPLAMGTSCADGDACNGLEACDGAGACQPGSAPVVDDGNVCTADACDAALGVSHTAINEGSPCGQHLACQQGTCTYFNRPPLFASTPVTDFIPGAPIAAPQVVTMGDWVTVNHSFNFQGPGHWVVDATQTSVTQTNNPDPTLFVGNTALEHDHMEGTLKVTDLADDDFVGFVFGYQNSTHFYLFDWKATTQESAGIAQKGMTVKVVSATLPITAQDLWPTTGNGTRVRPLYHNDIPWAPNVSYRFSFDVHPGTFTIKVTQGTTVLDTITINDSTYATGRFGFYNYSEGPDQYAGWSSQELNDRVYRYDADATDPDGDSLTYSLVDAPAGMSIDPATGAISWPVSLASVGAYAVTVRAQDADGSSAIQTFTLNIAAANRAPVVSAGPDLVAALPDTVALAGSAADDHYPFGSTLTCAWSTVSGPGTVTFEAVSSPQTTATFAADGAYLLRLGCSDGALSASDDVAVTVTPPSP